MKDIQNLLNQVSIISKKNAEILDASGSRFNMFGVLGVDHYENTHSAILKEFLDTQGSHGLKESFLEEFFKTLFDPEKFKLFKNEFAFDNSKAYTEYPTKDGRIDILIEDNQKHAIIIENKVYAVDQWKQLKRYKEFAEEKYGKGNYLILYLTLQGTEASKDSGEGVDYIQISYSSFIIEWLEKCVHIAARHPFVRETISQYINHVRKLTNQDMDTKNSKEIVELLTLNIENINAALTIHRNYYALCQKIIDEIIEKHLLPQMNKFAKDNNLILCGIIGKENSINIEFESSVWKKCRMLINTEGTNIYGFRYLDKKDKIAPYAESEIKKHISKFNTSDWWPMWIRTDNFKYINIDIWRNEIRDGAFGDYLISLFSELLDKTKTIEL